MTAAGALVMTFFLPAVDFHRGVTANAILPGLNATPLVLKTDVPTACDPQAVGTSPYPVFGCRFLNNP